MPNSNQQGSFDFLLFVINQSNWMSFNSNKHQLIALIDHRIASIDAQCAFLTHQISLYSDQTLAQLTLKTQAEQQQVNTLQAQKNHRLSKLANLRQQMAHLRQEGKDIQQKCNAKQEELKQLSSHEDFLQEKYEEEAPHIHPYLQEKAKSAQNTAKAKYAKQKLNRLHSRLTKQWEEVQYQNRLNNLIRHKLKQITDSKTHLQRNTSTGTSSAAANSADSSKQTAVESFKEEKKSEMSDFNESVVASFRD